MILNNHNEVVKEKKNANRGINLVKEIWGNVKIRTGNTYCGNG